MRTRLAYHVTCFLLGGLYGWVGDGGHVLSSVLEYPSVDQLWWPGLAWWVIPQFACGGLLLSFVVRAVYQRVGQPKLPSDFPSYTIGIGAALMSLATYLLSSVLAVFQFEEHSISIILCVLSLLLAFLVSLPHRGVSNFALIGVVAFIGGITWESSLCAVGVFRYIEPNAGLYVNHWIGWLWAAAIWTTIVPMWRFEAEHAEKKRKTNKKRTQ